MNDQELTFDWNLLGKIARRRVRLWVITALVIWIGLTLLCLFLVPRTFTATASVALQQSPTPGGALGALAGLGGSSTKTYAGVIHSRRFALAAARATNIQTLYHLPTQDAATDIVQNGVTMEDKQDGLIYLTVNLTAPPKLVPGQSEQVQKIRETVPAIAAVYVKLLSHYLDTTNTNRDAALIREAQKQLAKARANYDRAVYDFGRTVRASSSTTSPSLSFTNKAGPSGGTASENRSNDATDAVSQLVSLYSTRARLEEEIASGDALQHGTAALASGSPQTLAALPGEDPLLQDARRQAIQAGTQLKNLRIDLSDDNPEVIAARERLQIAQGRLKSESGSLRLGHTSESVRQQAIRAQYVTVMRQIKSAERNAISSRAMTLEIEKQRNEMLLRLEVLKATATQTASLSLQKGAGNNLLDIIDVPQVPKSGRPAASMMIILCFFIALFLIQAALIVEYSTVWYRNRVAYKANVIPHSEER